MIIKENITIEERGYVRQYSDKNVYIEDEKQRRYSEAIDPADHVHEYTETDIPIDESTDIEQKAAAFDYLTGRSGSDE